MAQRTYMIGLYYSVYAARQYIARWQIKIEQNATTEQYTCILALLEALNECLPLIQPPPPVE
jgi:hypothetical protein